MIWTLFVLTLSNSWAILPFGSGAEANSREGCHYFGTALVEAGKSKHFVCLPLSPKTADNFRIPLEPH